MPPTLTALAGPLKGWSFELPGDGALAVGRHPDNGLQIPDPAVSRHHCRLEAEAGGWRILDLDSRSGTFLNGRLVRRADLSHGDLVSVGGSIFLVALRPETETSPDLAAISPETETEVLLAVEDSVYLHPDRLASPTGPARSLGALLRLAAAVQEQPDLLSLGREILRQALAVTPAGRAALLPPPAGPESFEPLYEHADPAGSGPFPISSTVFARALAGNAAVLWSDVREAEPPDSVLSAGIGSLACVPLHGPSGPLAILYLDSQPPAERLDREHLELLAAIAVLTSGALAAALRNEALARENRRLQGAALGHGLVGESAPMRRIADVLARAAPAAATVLILGESGTGKELAARAVHLGSPRAGRPFIAINCATLSETLLESELFGHERGAFTGAVERKTGKLELAHGGTLFLDEVGEMPLTTQAKLLRVLQERTFERVGGTRPIAVDIRLVAATNRDLKKSIAEGSFRPDLYYRLNVISATMPPLRERREDIPLLASHFAALHGQAVRGRALGLSAEARALLLRYDWPGNVRELGNAIERAAVLGQEDLIRPEDLPESLLETAAGAGDAAEPVSPYHEAINRLKRRLIVDAVVASRGVILRAAERLGLHPNHLHRLITTLGLREEIEEMIEDRS